MSSGDAAGDARLNRPREAGDDDRRQFERAKDEFLATLAHELRNPLAPIQNAALILRSEAATDEARRYAVDVVDRQVRQLARLVDDLMDLSHVTTGRLELRRRPVDIRDVLRLAMETTRPLIERAGHEFTVTLPPMALVVDADLPRLAQVVGNLLNNAAKYTERGGQIALSARRERDAAVISVRDSGIGIAPGDTGRIFDMFVQGTPAWPHSEHGLGLGLTLARRLVALHHGTLVADSAGPGCGSEFLVRLPVLSPVPDAPDAPRAAPAAAARKLRVLVVDDNIDAAETLAMFLEFRGHAVRVCHEGPTALAMADQYRPEVLLLDIGLPGMSGCDVARTLRQRRWAEDAMIIALSGWNQDRDREASRAAGMNHHLVKPVDHEVLERLLADVRPPAQAS
jgi:CheY-like chemotaxis protein